MLGTEPLSSGRAVNIGSNSRKEEIIKEREEILVVECFIRVISRCTGKKIVIQ